MGTHIFKAALLLALCSGAVHAKTLYVNSGTGNDSVSYASNSEATPWRTLGRATWGSASRNAPNTSEAARAGDTVLVTGGPFSAASTNSRITPAFNPANSGTANAPITFRAQGRVELRSSGGIGPTMGADNRQYIRWEGAFYIDEANAPISGDTGPVTIWGSTGIVVDGCEIRGRPITFVDNHNGVRFEASRQSTLRNCKIEGIVGTSTPNDTYHHNKAGVMLYYSSDIIIENNEISTTGAGIYPKGGDNANITVRYNLIRDTFKGIRTSHSAPGSQNRIYQNIVYNGRAGGIGIEVAENSYGWTVANNTVHGIGDSGLYVHPAPGNNVIFANNIISNTPVPFNAWDMNDAVPGRGENLYASSSGQRWAFASREYSSLSAWLGAAPSDAGSITAASAGFVNAAGADFKLTSGSVARTLGVDILDLNRNGSTSDQVPAGAYVTGNEVIGRNAGPYPRPPTSLTVE